MTHNQELFFGVPVTGEVAPQGVDLDGTYDYFSRTSDLVGNVDSKTFTFSAWVYRASTAVKAIYYTPRFKIVVDTGGEVTIVGYSATPTLILSAQITNFFIPLNTHINIQGSIDLANTANRSIYIGDNLATVSWNTYSNVAIEFTQTTHNIGYDATTYLKGRLSNVFLDYTYRDLSIEANRRLFIDANGKPAAGWKALSPIIGMSMKDAATAHINDFGTGGNFTPNGTYATSNRGANQDNCVASYFDGVADYLSRTSLTGVADGKQVVVSGTAKSDGTKTNTILELSEGGVGRFMARLKIAVSGFVTLEILAYDLSSTPILQVQYSGKIPINSIFHFALSIDLSDANKRTLFINGSLVAPTWLVYTNSDINLLQINEARIGRDNGTTYSLFTSGELYFNTNYIDLATNNPFWDSTTNKPISVRKVIADTGVVPLIAMPLDASNAGKSYGNGGDFTANSAPYVGARGASEFWARSATVNGTTGYFSNLSSLGADSNTLSFVCSFRIDTMSTEKYILEANDGTTSKIEVYIESGNQMRIKLRDSSATLILDNTGIGRGGSLYFNNTTSFNTLFFSIDVNNNVRVWVMSDGVIADYSGAIVSATAIDLGGVTQTNLCAKDITTPTSLHDGDIAFTYFTTDYIDFSQEVNRLKFVDGLGYPLDLKKQIESGAIPTPLFYLPFDDTTNLGKDASGNGNHFTVNGTVTDGADVLG